MNITLKNSILNSKVVKRIGIFVFAMLFALGGFDLSLVLSAKPITYEEKRSVKAAIEVLKKQGFRDDAWYLEHVTVFRSSDNWLNSSVDKENAYAATNFPFEIMTLYPEFFSVALDDTEQAAILLHESQHLKGKNEKDAYEFVWKNRKQLGWTSDKYRDSEIWQNVRKQTREYAPLLFICQFNEFNDCTDG